MMNKFKLKYKKIAALCLTGALLLGFSRPVHAAPTADEQLARQRTLPIQSNEVENWPEGPAVGAASAILMDANTGTILYAKNIHDRHYPASTTKILTTLIAAERCGLEETVTFSHDAVFDTPRESNNIAIDEGETLTMEQSLNAILIRSANEVSYAVAEHITGTSWQDFGTIMNERAAELGCQDSNFVNPNGLPDENHYTSAYDLAMIGRAFFANEMLCRITTTNLLEIPATDTQPDHIIEANAMQLLPGKQYAYEYLVGCKTGYTESARSCLVSCAEKDGLKLICVVLRDETPYQYEDTIALFNYGFSNFDKVNVSQTETKYNIDNAGFFYSENDVFGSSQPILSLNQNDCIILPKTASFADTDSTISYDNAEEDQVALISYSYHGVPIGTASVDFIRSQSSPYRFDFAQDDSQEPAPKAQTPVIFINIIRVLTVLAILAAAVFLFLFLRAFLRSYRLTHRNSRWNWRRNRKRHHYTPYRENASSIGSQRKKHIQQTRHKKRRR